MKSLKFLFISLISLLAVGEVSACWGPWYTAKGYYMYRVYDSGLEPASDIGDYPLGVARNCKEWQKLTSDAIPLEDIYNVVYKMTLEDFEALYENRGSACKNRFTEWITKKDTTILDFLYLAKNNEHIRLKRNSRWYYPSMKIDTRMTLEEIAQKAVSAKESKLRDRYLLQAVRALFSLSKYEECIELWEKEIERLPKDNLMRQLIHPYIAGARYHTKQTEKAIESFAQIGDVRSMLFCAGRANDSISTIDALELVCEYAPNSRFIEETLQSYVRRLEPEGEFYWEDRFENTTDTERLYDLCLKMARGGKSNNPAMWYYTAAFLADLDGDAPKAARLLRLAEKSKSSPYIAESIKVFRIYLDAKLLPLDISYESRLFAQLRWLDAKIESNIDDEVRRETARATMLSNGESYYYWNDMMRRILLAEVCPRMIKAGKTTRALQLANMADNRLLNLVDKHERYDWQEDRFVHYSTMSAYRYSTCNNLQDYSNDFFEMIDSLGVDSAVKYLSNVENPKSDFDRFLNSRGYTGSDYLNDIVGTQYLRNMKYKEAVKYLGAVGVSYKNHHNLFMEHEPFSYKNETIDPERDFKYAFAKEMYSLEQGMNLTTEPNRKALLLFRYATGIRNSFGICWELTQYYRGTNFWGQVCEKRDWEHDKYTEAAKRKASELFKKACEMATDAEIAANMQYELCNFRTVAQQYPETEKGILVRGKCDRLIDYCAFGNKN